MIKVQILAQCEHCQGQAYLPIGEGEDHRGRKYTRYAPCPMCEGSGNQPKWIPLPEFAVMLNQNACTHRHTAYKGGMHFGAGDVWDDIQEICVECGAPLDGQTVGDLIQDEE